MTTSNTEIFIPQKTIISISSNVKGAGKSTFKDIFVRTAREHGVNIAEASFKGTENNAQKARLLAQIYSKLKDNLIIIVDDTQLKIEHKGLIQLSENKKTPCEFIDVFIDRNVPPQTKKDGELNHLRNEARSVLSNYNSLEEFEQKCEKASELIIEHILKEPQPELDRGTVSYQDYVNSRKEQEEEIERLHDAAFEAIRKAEEDLALKYNAKPLSDKEWKAIKEEADREYEMCYEIPDGEYFEIDEDDLDMER